MKVKELYAYLHVEDAAAAIAFYERAFGARETLRLAEPGGRIGHAELELDGARLMLADEHPQLGIRGPRSLGGTSITIHLHVDDADAAVARAVAAGATLEREVQDQFYGERSGCILDPFGHRWNLGHAIEEVSADEMQRRYSALTSGRTA